MVREGHWETLDVYKGFALSALIGLHTLIWWLSQGRDGQIQGLSDEAILVLVPYCWALGWLALSFVFISGISFQFFLKKSQLSFLSVFKRVVFFAVLGFSLNPQSWYIFQFLALSTGLAFLVLRVFNLSILTTIAVLSLYFIQTLRDFLSPWEGSYWKAILVGDKTNQYFWPFFPWFSLFVAGLIFGRLKKLKISQKRAHFLPLMSLILGLVLINFSAFFDGLFLKIEFNDFWGSHIFQPSLMNFLGWMGLILFALACFDFIMQTRWNKCFHGLSLIGRYSLFIYLIHYKIFVVYIFRYKNDSLTRWLCLVFIQLVLSYLLALVFNRIEKYMIHLGRKGEAA